MGRRGCRLGRGWRTCPLEGVGGGGGGDLLEEVGWWCRLGWEWISCTLEGWVGGWRSCPLEGVGRWGCRLGGGWRSCPLEGWVGVAGCCWWMEVGWGPPRQPGKEGRKEGKKEGIHLCLYITTSSQDPQVRRGIRLPSLPRRPGTPLGFSYNSEGCRAVKAD